MPQHDDWWSDKVLAHGLATSAPDHAREHKAIIAQHQKKMKQVSDNPLGGSPAAPPPPKNLKTGGN